MNNLEIDKNISKEEYNSEPVLYCKNCLSLAIMDIPNIDNSDYCDTCGCTEILSCSIGKWEKMYEEKYGHKYINIK